MHTPISDPTTSGEKEPSQIEPDRVLLRRLDGVDEEFETPRRLRSLVKHDGRFFTIRAVDQRNGRYVRIYYEEVPDHIVVVSGKLS